MIRWISHTTWVYRKHFHDLSLFAFCLIFLFPVLENRLHRIILLINFCHLAPISLNYLNNISFRNAPLCELLDILHIGGTSWSIIYTRHISIQFLSWPKMSVFQTSEIISKQMYESEWRQSANWLSSCNIRQVIG